MSFKNPSRPDYGNTRDRKSNENVCDGQSAVLEHRGVCELVGLLDFISTFPPETDDVDELRIRREELSKSVHIMPVPAFSECVDNLRYFSDCIGHLGYSFPMGGDTSGHAAQRSN
jgi:hypothetical protein